jgi:hypothetical protein
VLLMILSPSDTTSSFGYKQNKLLTQPHLPIRHKPASATKATKNSLKLRMANDIQSSTRYPESGCCSLPQQSIFQTPLTSMSTRQSTSPPTSTSTSTSPNCGLQPRLQKKCVFVQPNGHEMQATGRALDPAPRVGTVGDRVLQRPSSVCKSFIISSHHWTACLLDAFCYPARRTLQVRRTARGVLRHRYR